MGTQVDITLVATFQGQSGALSVFKMQSISVADLIPDGCTLFSSVTTDTGGGQVQRVLHIDFGGTFLAANPTTVEQENALRGRFGQRLALGVPSLTINETLAVT